MMTEIKAVMVIYILYQYSGGLLLNGNLKFLAVGASGFGWPAAERLPFVNLSQLLLQQRNLFFHFPAFLHHFLITNL